MAASVITFEAANIFCGDDDPNNSKHLTLQSVQIWQPKEKTESHHAGGAIGAIEIGGLGFEAPEVTFDLVGIDAQTAALFGLGQRGTRPYTIYAAMRDKNAGRLIERKVVVLGRMVEVGEDAYERGKLVKQSHAIKEITHYEMFHDRHELYYYDFFASTWRVNGVNQLAEANAILRIA